jgi:hypothetical protein
MKFSNALLFVIFTFLILNTFAYLYNSTQLPRFPISTDFIQNITNPSKLAENYGITDIWIIPQWFIADILYPLFLIIYIFSTLISIIEFVFSMIFYFVNFFPTIISIIINFFLLSLLIISFISSLKLGGSGIE